MDFYRSFVSPQQVPPRCSAVSTLNEIPRETPRDDSVIRQLSVTLLADEWGSKKGGISTMNRELAVNLANISEINVQVTFLVPENSCSDGEKREAETRKVDIVEVKKRPGIDDPLDWLFFPTNELKVDVVVGHGVKLGRQAQIIRESHKCKWLQVVHTAPKEISAHKEYGNPISRGQKKKESEIELCKIADCVMAVGPKLKGVYSGHLRGCGKEENVFKFTPGIIQELANSQPAANSSEQFKVLVFGRSDVDDFMLKGYDIAAKAFACHELKRYCLVFVGASKEKLDEVTKRLRKFGISKKQLDVRPFVESRQELKELLREVDLAIMPSRTEGFGLVALEALSAGLPILVSGDSGFAEALNEVPFGRSYIVHSEDPKVWAGAIKAVQRKGRVQRLQEIRMLRASYEEKYSWEKQCGILADTMWNMVHGKNRSQCVIFPGCNFLHQKNNLKYREMAFLKLRRNFRFYLV